ncbi:hypothetical protein [Novilysobacter erysipheiresistens]|uniref:Uncharacterized protein n=1 Tax=Novilysobacter erysipheiresistens TaxID=1749332 RepID=A0ABU7Z031_9GAMM
MRAAASISTLVTGWPSFIAQARKQCIDAGNLNGMAAARAYFTMT